MAAKLTVERLFNGPNLAGPRLQSAQVSPDGKYVTYLQGKIDDKDQLDLWGFDTKTGKSTLLVDSRTLLKGTESLSSEEAARRERQRTANLRGIVEYKFAKDGRRLLIPLGGDLYIYDLQAPRNAAVQRLTTSPSYETDARFSPRGRYVSFIRDQNLWIVDVRSGQERQLTRDGGGSVSNGVAEFIAQEEMDRDTGYWWAPDESHIAFTRIDDSAVRVIERFEIYSDTVKTVKQSYPVAGSANTQVELKIINIDSNQTKKVLAGPIDGYLARVDWFPDSQSLAVQRESRDQQQLELLKIDVRTAQVRTLVTETSNTWINLGDNIAFVRESRAFVWASQRTGQRHLYLYSEDGEVIRPITAGPWSVTGEINEHCIDGTRGLVFFHSAQSSPLEQQLYAASLTTQDPNQPARISKEEGWHVTQMLPDRRGYLDSWTAPSYAPSVAIRNIDGSLRQWLLRNELNASHPYAPYLVDHTTEEFGSLPAADGQLLYFRIIKPKDMVPNKRYPVIFDIYGGPGNQYVQKTWMGGARGPQGFFRQLLAQHGFIVFSLDNRGTPRRGTAFEAPIFRRLGRVEIDDQVRGAEYLRSLPYVDGSRIGMMGWSYGGYMSLMALATAPQIFKAAVAGAPVTDWRLYDTHYTERYLGDPAENAAGYTASSVAPYVKNITGKLLLVHGMADDNVLFVNSTQLMKQLQDAHIPFQLMTYPGGKHGLIRQADMGQHFYAMVLKFFEENL